MHVTIQDRELLPHVFTLTILLWRYILCGTFCHLHQASAFPLGSVSLYVARTFLSSQRAAIEPVCFATKIVFFFDGFGY